MWTYQGLRIREGKAWRDNDGVMHPGQWTRWSTDEKIAKGLVWVDDPIQYDSRFYTGDGTPKALEDVDSDGTIISYGLKSNLITTIKAQANSLLQPTDWKVVRAAETGEALDSDTAVYRAAVRSASNTIETAINATVTHDEFIRLYDTDSDGISIINNWPINNL